MRPDGCQDFEALRTKAGAAGAAYFAFDVLELDGKDLRPLSLKERRSILAKLLRKPPHGIALSEVTDEDGVLVFEHACRLGLEGIVSKRLDRPYRSGASSSERNDTRVAQSLGIIRWQLLSGLTVRIGQNATGPFWLRVEG